MTDWAQELAAVDCWISAESRSNSSSVFDPLHPPRNLPRMADAEDHSTMSFVEELLVAPVHPQMKSAFASLILNLICMVLNPCRLHVEVGQVSVTLESDIR